MIPRSPNYEELKQLQAYLINNPGVIDPSLVIKFSFANAVAVFDDYKADHGDAVEKIMMVVWADALGYYQVFRWDRLGRLTYVRQDRAVA